MGLGESKSIHPGNANTVFAFPGCIDFCSIIRPGMPQLQTNLWHQEEDRLPKTNPHNKQPLLTSL